MCCYKATLVYMFAISDDYEQIGFSMEQFANTRALPLTSFNSQASSLIKKFYAIMELQITASRGADLIMHIVGQSRIYSAVHTNGFLTSVLGWDEYSIVASFYPLDDNSTSTNVSLF